MPGYTLVQDLLVHQPVPEEGILTRALVDDSQSRVVLFTFSKGQCLSEHTASSPASLHFLKGDATVTLGGDSLDAHPGTWIHMEANLPHSITTKSEVVMLLVLNKSST